MKKNYLGIHFCGLWNIKKEKTRCLSLLLAMAIALSTLSSGTAAIYASPEDIIVDLAEQDSAPLVVNETGESKSTFAMGETFHITGSKTDSAIQKAEVWCNGIRVTSKAVSATANGVTYDISVDTRELNLSADDLNQHIPVTVRFVGNSRAEENVEVEIKVTAEAMLEKDGDVKYLAKLGDAFEDNSTDGDITLLQDVYGSPVLSAMYIIKDSRTYSLNLNHHNITISQGEAVFYFNGDCSLTIKGEGTIELCESSGGVWGGIFYIVGKNVNINIEGGNFVSSSPIFCNSYKNNINISAGTFTSVAYYLFYNASNAGDWTYINEMPKPGYCFVNEQDEVLNVGTQTTMTAQSAGANVTVRKIDFERDAIIEIPEIASTTYVYKGKEYRPAVKSVSIAGMKLRESYDYRVDYENNINAGRASVIVSGAGSTYGFSGSKTFYFTIDKSELWVGGTGTASGVYGVKLSELEISGLEVLDWGWPCAGTWRIDDDTIPNAGDSGPYTAVFIPEVDNYQPLTREVTVSVSKAEGVLTVPKTTVLRAFSNEAFSLGCSTNGDGKISYVSDNESVAEILADGTVATKGIGTANITVSLEEGLNYTSAGAEEQSVTIKVVKGTAPELGTETKNYIYDSGSNGPVSINIADRLPENAGKTKFTLAATDSNGILFDVSVNQDGVLTYTVEKDKVAGSTAAIMVSVEMENYEKAVFTVNIGIEEKAAVELQPGQPVQTVEPDVPDEPAPTAIPSAKVTKAQQRKNALAINAGLKVSQTGNKITAEWGRVSGADGYDVYVQYCGNKFTDESIHSVNSGKTTKLTVKAVDGVKLDLKKNYRVYVLAYKMADGEKVTLGRSIPAHVVGRKKTGYTNAKAVKVKKGSYSLSEGATATIKASSVLVNKDKKQLSDAHAKEFRYATSNKKVATVTAKGKIQAAGKGSCTIYVYARNGYAQKVKVKVK